VLVIDNYDSFVYNLVQYLGELGAEPFIVHRTTPRSTWPSIEAPRPRRHPHLARARATPPTPGSPNDA
jgi:anthranilate/para-aminobenzoate synthase component II